MVMARPVKDIPYLELCNIDFSTLKRQSTVLTTNCSNINVKTLTNNRGKIASTSHTEKQNFFHKIAQEQNKSPIIFSVIQPYSNKFVHSCDHLPKLLQALFLPAYLESNYTELFKFAESHPHDVVTSAVVDHLAQLTCKQSKSRELFKYRAGRITASRFREVLHTDCHQPSLSFAKKHLLS